MSIPVFLLGCRAILGYHGGEYASVFSEVILLAGRGGTLQRARRGHSVSFPVTQSSRGVDGPGSDSSPGTYATNSAKLCPLRALQSAFWHCCPALPAAAEDTLKQSLRIKIRSGYDCRHRVARCWGQAPRNAGTRSDLRWEGVEAINWIRLSSRYSHAVNSSPAHETRFDLTLSYDMSARRPRTWARKQALVQLALVVYEGTVATREFKFCNRSKAASSRCPRFLHTAQHACFGLVTVKLRASDWLGSEL